jgi:hypothetical protein
MVARRFWYWRPNVTGLMIRGISYGAGAGAIETQGAIAIHDGRDTIHDGFRTATRNQTPPQTARKGPQGAYS